MKCKCGNENGKTLVFPRPITFTLKGEVVQLAYTGGQEAGTGRCWFCAFSRQGLALTDEQREYVRSRQGD